MPLGPMATKMQVSKKSRSENSQNLTKSSFNDVYDGLAGVDVGNDLIASRRIVSSVLKHENVGGLQVIKMSKHGE